MKIGGQLGYGLAVESDDVPHAEYTPDEYLIARIELDPCGIAFVGHGVVHGLVSCLSKNSLAFST